MSRFYNPPANPVDALRKAAEGHRNYAKELEVQAVGHVEEAHRLFEEAKIETQRAVEYEQTVSRLDKLAAKA